MTLDMIGGESYLPKRFNEGLNYWRNDLAASSVTTLDADPNFTLSTQANDTYGQLIVNKSNSTMAAVHGSLIPIIATQYLEVKFKIQLLSGSAPNVKIIGAATTSTGTPLPANSRNGPSVELVSGIEMEVSAIIGSGARPGVDLVWQTDVAGAYFGLELTGPNGGTVLVKDMQISDVSAAFLSMHSGMIDIRDYGGIGDGTTDCRDAFIAADAEANGRTLFLPEGDFYIGSELTIHSPLRCTGRIVADDATPIMLIHRYDLETYFHAFKNEEVAFRKGFQALFKFSDHNIFDMRGRRVELTAPVRFKELLPDISRVTYQRTICNGELRAWNSSQWNDSVATSSARYDGIQDPLVLSNVQNISQIDIGSNIHGSGVGRDVFVVDKNESAKTITLNRELYGPPTTQTYTFTRFKFLIDFCEVDEVKYFEMVNIRFQLKARASLIILAKKGIACKMTHLWVQGPKDRGICSYNEGCNGITVESCNFQSDEWVVEASERKAIAISTKKNDMKIRNNRCTYFRHFAVLGGTGHIISGNHFFQDNPNGGESRSAGMVLTDGFSKSLFVGNYIDNCWIECTQEHIYGDRSSVNAFIGYQTITGNHFTLSNIDDASGFAFIKFRPFGNNEKLVGLSVIGNVFVNYCDTNMESAEAIVTANGNIDWNKTTDVVFSGNSWRSINHQSSSPNYKKVSRSTSAKTWTEDFQDDLPFGAKPLRVISLVANSDLTSSHLPKTATLQGSGSKDVTFTFPDSTKGSLNVGFSMDIMK